MLSPGLCNKLFPAISFSCPAFSGLTQSTALSFLKITDPLVLLTVSHVIPGLFFFGSRGGGGDQGQLHMWDTGLRALDLPEILAHYS